MPTLRLPTDPCLPRDASPVRGPRASMLAWLACACVATGSVTSLAQPDEAMAPPAKAPSGEPDRGSDDAAPAGEAGDMPRGLEGLPREAITQRLTSRRDDARAAAEAIDLALARLASGEPVGAVLRDLGPMLGRMGEDRPGRRPARGGPGRDGDREPNREGEGQPLGGPAVREGTNPWRPGSLREPGNARPDDAGRAMEFLREHMPQMHQRLEALREADPSGFDRVMRRTIPRIRAAAAVRENDPELFALRKDEIRSGFVVLDAIRKYRDARAAAASDTSDARVVEATARLREALDAQFDSRARAQQHEIAALERRLRETRERFDKSQAERSESLERLLKNIIEGREMGDMPPVPPPPDRPDAPRPDAPPPGP